MEDTAVRDALRAHVAPEPPLLLTSARVVAAGRKSRRRHRGGVTAVGAVVVAGIVGVAALVVSPMLSGKDSPVASRPDPATCAALREFSPGPDITEPEAADRLSCFLLDAVPRMLPPGTTLAADPTRPGTAALIASTGGGGLLATAVIKDSEGVGMVLFTLGRAGEHPAPTEIANRCSGQTINERCVTGPRGEHVEVSDDGGRDEQGRHSRVIVVYSGRTVIQANALNVSPLSAGPGPTRDEPPLTVEQLIQLATNPALVLYP